VVLVGDDEDEYIPEYTEAQRIGIAIGVALPILVVALIVIYFVVSCYPRYSATIIRLLALSLKKESRFF